MVNRDSRWGLTFQARKLGDRLGPDVGVILRLILIKDRTLEGAHALRGLLHQLFVELNQPFPAMGIKQWSAKLTEDQRSVLAALPLPTPDRESVVTATHLLGQAFTSHARQAQLSIGSEWPDQAEAAVAASWIASGLTPETRWHQAREAASSPPNITDQNGTE